MVDPTAFRYVLIALVSAIAGVMNSLAGGGMLLTFPTLVALGIPPIAANATSTVALVPGSMGSVWGYRDELTGFRRWALWFAVPSLFGGLIGALLLLKTPPATFARLVPWLVLGATALFIVRGPIAARIQAYRRRDGDPTGVEAERLTHLPGPGLLGFQFFVAIYGGYFGAGVGILMLAALGMAGLTNIHRMNGLKNWAGSCMNVVAAATFAASGLVNWRVALIMAAGAVCGGYLGSRVAQRVGQRVVRGAIVTIGLGSGLWLLLSG